MIVAVRPVAAVERFAADDSNAAMAVTEPTPVNWRLRP